MIIRKSILSTTIASLLLTGAQVAAQSTAPETGMEEVLVTGIRSSLAQGMDIKRDSMEVVDSIVAEDIGKLPDNNVVESLQRVAGVQVTDRASGEASTVTIRGLNDISTTLNGRVLFTASGRSLALADIPSTLVNRVDVIKSRSASQYENGIAGQINVHTSRPFDFDGPRVQVNARGIYQDQAEKTDPNISALFSNRWDTGAGEVGALLNISYMRTNYRDQSTTAGAQLPYATENPPEGSILTPLERIFPDDPRISEDPVWQTGLQNGLPIDEGSSLSINGTDTEYYLARDAIFQGEVVGERERPAATIALQYSPNDSSEYTFEAMYTGYRNIRDTQGLFSMVDSNNALGDDLGSTFDLYEGTNVVKSRTVGLPDVFADGGRVDEQTDSFMYALSGEWDFTEKLQVKSDLMYQDSEFESDFFAMRVNGVPYQVFANFDDVAGFTFADDPSTATRDESDLTNPELWTMGQFYDSGGRDEGSAITFSTDADYATDWDFLHTLKFGVRYDDRDASEFDRNQDQHTICPDLVDDASLCRPENHEGLGHVNSNFMDGEAVTTTSWYAPDEHYISSNIGQFRELYNLEVNPQLMKTFGINEKNTALYATGQFEVGKLDGELGFRYIDVQTDMTFYGDDTSDVSRSSKGNSEFLTNLMLRYHITDELLLRASYGETLRMPNFSDLNSRITYADDTTDIGYGSASGGNPDLEPTTSQNYDLSLEYYFGDASMAHVTLFRRDIKDLVVTYRNRIQADLDGYNADSFVLTLPDNASEGMLEGVEIGFSYFPDLSGNWNGVGVTSSFTLLDSEQTNPQTNDAGEVTGYETGPMYGVSDTSYSVTLAYERDTFDARLSYVWRDNFLYADDAALFANPLSWYRDAEESLDMQVSYNATDSLTLTLDATNLTGQLTKRSYGDSPYHSFSSELYSTTYALGVRYSF
ncbi:TonB-dependent receptor [Marinimicrobium sp. ARAG 43.8]|uniref:TonB-dependent receptor n=1 Tax=Marinimicrobium sp. ARAG 43.8 TaxID=3418719 RepID=UPI003CEE16EC